MTLSPCPCCGEQHKDRVCGDLYNLIAPINRAHGRWTRRGKFMWAAKQMRATGAKVHINYETWEKENGKA